MPPLVIDLRVFLEADICVYHTKLIQSQRILQARDIHNSGAYGTLTQFNSHPMIYSYERP